MKSGCPKVRLIANYLPQYHPIPENDEWWGKGFTEWTNVAKAKPLFKGSCSLIFPLIWAFMIFGSPETREAQAEMAKRHGIEAFCYWHYWFNGHRLLERIFNEVLESKKPAFPFLFSMGQSNMERYLAWKPRPNFDGTNISRHQRSYFSLLYTFEGIFR